MLRFIKTLGVLAMGVFVKARDRDFNPMAGIEVLTHGETQIASFPAGNICCNLISINAPIDSTEYYENTGPFATLHVTSVGIPPHVDQAQDGEKHLHTVVYSKVNRPSSYRNFAFDVEHRYGDFCADAQSHLMQNAVKTEVIDNKDQASRFDYMRNREKSGFSKEAAFTFFGPGINSRETAVIHCWPLEDDVLIGARLRAER